MKLKGISVAEQHFEKGIVGLLALAALGVAVWEFGFAQVRVPMDGQPDGVAPSEVDDLLKSAANRVRAQQAADAPSQVEFHGPSAGLQQQFSQRLQAPVAPATRLAANQPALAGSITPMAATADIWFHEPKFSSLSMQTTEVTSDALADEARSADPELAARFPQGTPSDVTWTTPIARLNMGALIAEMARAEPQAAPGRSAVPPPWFNDHLPIVDVLFERSTLQPDGKWGPAEEVAPLPGALTFRPRTGSPDAKLRDDVFDQLEVPLRQWDILQPAFLDTKGERFEMPTLGGGGPEQAETPQEIRLRKLQKRLLRDRTDLAKAEDDLRKAGGAYDPTKDPSRGNRGTGGSGGGGSGGGGGGGGGRGGFGGGGGGGDGGGGSMGGRRGSGDDAGDGMQKRKMLTNRVRELQDSVTKLTEQVTQLQPDAPAAAPERGAPWAESDVLVWAHDLSVQPGSTYRDRCTLRAYNPFFAKGTQLVSQQSPLADGFLIETPVSDWGQPVTVRPPIDFFVTSATPSGGEAGGGAVAIEIFRLLDGVRLKQTCTVMPGDVIGRPDKAADGAEAIDFATGWFVLDVLIDPTVEGRPETQSMVLVQRLNSDDPALALEFRSPGSDSSSALRRRLQAEVDEGAGSRAAPPAATDPAEPAGRSRLGGSGESG